MGGGRLDSGRGWNQQWQISALDLNPLPGHFSIAWGFPDLHQLLTQPLPRSPSPKARCLSLGVGKVAENLGSKGGLIDFGEALQVDIYS